MKKLKNTQENSATTELRTANNSQLRLESTDENQNSSTSLRIEENEIKRKLILPEYYQVLNSPFTLVCINKFWRICIGNNIIHEKEFKSKKAALKTIDEKGWDLLFSVFTLICSTQKPK